MSQPIPAHAERVMRSLADGLGRILGERLVGVYLGGSLSLGDYCEATSDLDFLVVTRGRLAREDLAALEAFHRELLAADPAARRLEGDYAPQECIVPEGTTIPVPGCKRGVFRPEVGEIMLSADNVCNLRENGIAFAGPPPAEVLPPVSPDQVRAAVREMLAEGPGNADRPEEQVDDLLNLFRSLCALETGRPTTKSQGADWVRRRVEPRWLPVIDAALEARRLGTAAGWTEDLRESAAALDRLLRQRYCPAL
ncbi:hypothetical protein J2Z79_002983 [Symbiobacterium terraclitae]|uniref:DUF4111 domain-containing protein n=1 Tax=Symbiobacterium terraclitae TaxID=557451 RepID=A0ABS4JVJ0_9FIRM|nr:aminoglycoside adenylyltransferase domain-containing protein [Symbiobacterium terraclitae]MBP2019541.1 hypothetical protein [Symbiobacterium terraclitae]